MLLGVEVGGERHLADVGFGGQTPTGPLRLEAGTVQETPHERFRLVPAGDGFVLETDVRGTWKPMYRFDLREQHAVDYEVANWYVSTHPGSHFLASLLAARPAPGRRYGLWDNVLSIHADGGTEKRVLADAAELRSVLTDLFRITLPAAPELDAALARAAAKPPPAG
jgi:N-hydroxyarylamine O-acetyltransferase